MLFSRQRARGYSLVELAIVLVIVGLITGGILVGSSMIKSAELQSVGKDFQTYQQAMQTFYDSSFDALPGDFAGAVAQWGAVTEDGNDDGAINDPVVDEPSRAWQHLSLADMVDVSYSGTGQTAGIVTAGVNLPASRITNGGFIISALQSSEILGGTFADPAIILFRANVPSVGVAVPIITPAEAFEIDNKFDDGNPGSGAIRAPGNAGIYTLCTTSNDPATARYNATNQTQACILSFRARIEK